ncbi:hypothetical protein KP509_03G066700 [Ceratopteris richardii]|uniref:RNA-binding S4 domain-containing protein n=1 Tax=Ceratopteris richardii TaxID=49495 RepID=A0A8T2V3P1_CERRI|nr:hypothetical protein KP509_03G066700 [Ceratopteris richardii]
MNMETRPMAPTSAAAACVPVERFLTQFCSQELLTWTGRLVSFGVSGHGYKRVFRSARLQCQAANGPLQEKKELLAGVHKDHIESVVRILEQAKTAAARWDVVHSDFLTPPAIEDALKVLKRLSDIDFIVSGGYPQAERCRLSLGHKDAFLSTVEEDYTGYPGAVAAVSILGDFMFDRAVHGDFLGSILGTGIAREKVGDILLQGDTGAQAVIVSELVNFLETSLTQVRNTPVICKLIRLEEIHYHPPRVQIIKSVEASLRVDAVASAGFKMSRSKLVDLISAGNVRVNWKQVTKNGFLVKSGDMVSVTQKGRVEVGEIRETRKGKYHVELLRYL